jgi:membrane-associated protease RseP (regulator of RpoE activity)
MTLALEVLGWLIFLVGIGVSIGLHEIGHLVPAKAFGVKVTQYMVGFGPTIWSRRKGETEYGVKAIPLGGYIRMIGMYPPAPGTDGTMLRASSTGRFSALIDDARKQSLEEVTPADADRVFYKLPVPKRIVIMLGGPTMNLVLAFVLLTIVVSLIGLPQSTTTIGATTPCVPTSANTSGQPKNGSCFPSQWTPAAVAGLHKGDRLVSFGGTPIRSWDAATNAIKGASSGPVPVVVERGGQLVTLAVAPVVVPRPIINEQCKVTGYETRTFVGVSPGSQLVTRSVTTVPPMIWEQGTKAVQTLVALPVRMWDLMRQTFTSEQRDCNGIVGVVGVGRLTGDAVALQDTPIKDKAAFILGLLAGLNLFLFLFNLIPLLPLDGGHVAGAVWEAIKKGWARMRHLPTPGPVDIAKALPLTYVVSGLLLLLGLLTIVADLVKPITFT